MPTFSIETSFTRLSTPSRPFSIRLSLLFVFVFLQLFFDLQIFKYCIGTCRILIFNLDPFLIISQLWCKLVGLWLLSAKDDLKTRANLFNYTEFFTIIKLTCLHDKTPSSNIYDYIYFSFFIDDAIFNSTEKTCLFSINPKFNFFFFLSNTKSKFTTQIFLFLYFCCFHL